MSGWSNREQVWLGRVANVVVPTILTALAFAVLSRWGLVGDLPLWVLVVLLAASGAAGELTNGLIQPDSSALELHVGLAVMFLGVTAIIYAIGWGPTLSIGYVFVLARALDAAGSRVWRTALLWTVVGIGLGQLAIALHLVSDVRQGAVRARLGRAVRLGIGVRRSAARNEDRADRDRRSRGALHCVALERDPRLHRRRRAGGRRERQDHAVQLAVRADVAPARRHLEQPGRRCRDPVRARSAGPAGSVRREGRRAVRATRRGERRHARVQGRPGLRTALPAPTGRRSDRRPGVELPRRDRSHAAARPARAPGLPRQSHGAREPRAAARSPRARTGAVAPVGGHRCRAVLRPRRLQDDQRHARPRLRRPPPHRGRSPLRAQRARRRHGRPARRRRVRGGARRDDARRRRGHGCNACSTRSGTRSW